MLFARLLLLLLGLTFAVGARCGGAPFQQRGHPLFESPQVQPLALSADATRLYVANTTSGTLSVIDVSNPAAPVELAQIPVGMDPVSVAVRPKVVPGDPDEDELVFVSNHISDSISVVSRERLDVVQTIQELTPEGVTTTDEPVGVAFASPFRAFVALDHPNQVLVLDLDAAGTATLSATRLAIAAQAPRAIAVVGGRLYVAAFESGNQTEFPTCAPDDPRGLDVLDPFDMGCEFHLDSNTSLTVLNATNRGGRVIHDGDLPDRDLFVFDATTLAPLDVIEGVGTLLHGVASGGSGSRIFVTHTEARNLRNGLGELQNRMFENRLAWVDCLAGCTSHAAPVQLDLDALAGVPITTPHGVAVSGDGALVAVTAAGSDGTSGLPGDPGASLPGLVLLGSNGSYLASLPLGAMPRGVAIRSDAGGVAEWAFVSNELDGTISIVDLAQPSAPSVAAVVGVGADPTPADVRRGRILFSAGRASTGGRFACASCHPNGNTDQLLWTINSVDHPDDGPDGNGVLSEPRVTQPVRGLRGTLPLHWDGSLGDPLPGTVLPGDSAPDCDLSAGEITCFRHLVDASLSGVMCDPLACPVGSSTLPGALSGAERNDLARYLMAVSYPPSPARRPDGALTASALEGARDFFTPDNGLGPNPDYTCADPDVGCHQLPLLVGTNNASHGDDAPTFRGLWDRFILFSGGHSTSQEALALAQDCADGIGPVDPCFTLALGGATQDVVWDPLVGMTERGSLMSVVNLGDRFLTGLRGPELWSFVSEMAVGLPALTGRQVSIDSSNAASADILAAMDEIELAAQQQRIVARAENVALGSFAWSPAASGWRDLAGPTILDGQALRDFAAAGEVVRITAWPAANVVPAGLVQPLIWPEIVATPGGTPNLPRPPAGGSVVLRFAESGVSGAAAVLVDGAVCASCSVTPITGGGGESLVDILLDPVPAVGPHMLQVANPRGLESNELLVIPE